MGDSQRTHPLRRAPRYGSATGATKAQERSAWRRDKTAQRRGTRPSAAARREVTRLVDLLDGQPLRALTLRPKPGDVLTDEDIMKALCAAGAVPHLVVAERTEGDDHDHYHAIVSVPGSHRVQLPGMRVCDQLVYDLAGAIRYQLKSWGHRSYRGASKRRPSRVSFIVKPANVPAVLPPVEQRDERRSPYADLVAGLASMRTLM